MPYSRVASAARTAPSSLAWSMPYSTICSSRATSSANTLVRPAPTQGTPWRCSKRAQVDDVLVARQQHGDVARLHRRLADAMACPTAAASAIWCAQASSASRERAGTAAGYSVFRCSCSGCASGVPSMV